LKFDQRNSLIVGLVMGFAVIAPIFSISEDALFAVPRHITNGSLALGATQWQTLIRVVLPTASPGIFSAVMIGFGRAVGETMIVLMATGNTPVMEWNIFEGMRTLSANVAVEMGEAEVGSTHFRVLFLSALVLFVLTFVLNTVAEVVRGRLRKKYGSL
jgi:phosphate transport system permease protein